MDIRPVNSHHDLKQFIELPYKLYKNDKIWVPPLRSEQWAQFKPDSNPMLKRCAYSLFLLWDHKKVIGRISAFVDSLAIETWAEPIGLFGSFECTNDEQAASILLDGARNWLKEYGMKAMRGPWSFASQEWGMVVEGYEPPPVILAPYNPPFYNELLTKYGMAKVKDLLVYYMDARENYQIPDRILLLTEKVQKRYGVCVRAVNMENLEKEVMTIVDLANRSIADNWGFYPVTEAEGRGMAKDLKAIINPKAVLIAEDSDGKPIGFAMSLPDINVVLKKVNGRMLPFGWLKLLRGIPKLKQYRMWALGVIPEYQGKAIDTLLYKATYDAIYNPQMRLEINYVLEDNERMNNALAKLNAKPLRRYRIYEMEI
jgi:ribosomal protein S18 acetylase RimI-like enzyme